MESKQCPTSSSNMISAPRTSTIPHTLPQPSPQQSQTSCINGEHGRDTSILAGASTMPQSKGHTTMPITSRLGALESGCSSDSPTRDIMVTNTLPDDEKTCKRRAETIELNNTTNVGVGVPKKKKMETSAKKVMTEIHLLICAAGDAYGKWEKELESVHGLSESEACFCVNLMLEHLHDDRFPDDSIHGNKHDPTTIRLVREGIVLMKHFDGLIKKYTQESGEMICRADGWRIV